MTSAPIDQNSGRADPTAGDMNLAQFEKSRSPPYSRRANLLEAMHASERASFPGRSKMPAHLPARYRFTGRNVQINIKVTHEVWARWVDVADEHRFAYGELLEHALDAFLEKRAAGR